MLLGATNSWFAVKESALSIPRHEDELHAARRDAPRPCFDAVQELSELAFLRRRGELAAFADVDDETLLAAIQRYRAQGSTARPPATSARPSGSSSPATSDRPGLTSPPARPRARRIRAASIERVVLSTGCARCRRSSASPGSTRPSTRESSDDRRVPLGRGNVTFLPAAEVHGEGIFVQLDEVGRRRSGSSETASATTSSAARTRAWRERRRIPDPQAGYPGLRLVLVHTLSHALMRRLALECGYSQASIRERIYALPPEHEDGPMAGVLLYTAAPDSEGTLGGLVALGEPAELARHVARRARSTPALCASDPLCAEHDPTTTGITLHGAACHACLFAPETSCERGNRYLDRAVLAELDHRARPRLPARP